MALKRNKPRLLAEPLRQLKLLRALRYGQIVRHHRIHIYAKLRAQRIRANALNKVFRVYIKAKVAFHRALCEGFGRCEQYAYFLAAAGN